MPLTRDFKETVQVRAERDREFREGLLKEGVRVPAGRATSRRARIVLRDYINATIGFEELSSLTGMPPKSLMRMFGPSGNPHARNLFQVINHIQQHEGIQLESERRSVVGRSLAGRTPALQAGGGGYNFITSTNLAQA